MPVLLDDKIAALVPEIGSALQTELQSALRTLRGGQNPVGVLLGMSRLSLRLLGDIYTRVGQKLPSDNLYDCIVTAARGDPQKRLTGLRFLPDEMASYLHTLRTLSNKADHAAERVALSTADAENALNMFMRVLEWFFCESEHGPQLSGIYTATQPQPLTPEHATALPTRQAGFGSLLRGLLQWRKLLLSLSAIALLGLAMSMLLPYVSVLRAHRLWQQASHEDEIKQAGEAYQAALEKLRGRFWNTQRAVMLNRLGRIYAARRFAGYALHFYSEAIKENPNLATAYTNKAFLLEEGAEKEAYLSAKTDKFDEALGLYQQARQKDPADRFARALQEGVLRRQQTALSRAQVEELLARPQQCSGLPNAADGTPLTIALHMAAPRHDSFAQRAGEGEVLVQRLVQTFRENQRLVVQEHALEDECFVVRLLAVYSILRSATDALHKSTLWVQVLATDTAKIQADAQVEWTHEQLDGVAEQLASTLWQRLQSKTSHPGSG